MGAVATASNLPPAESFIPDLESDSRLLISDLESDIRPVPEMMLYSTTYAKILRFPAASPELPAACPAACRQLAGAELPLRASLRARMGAK